MISYFKNLDLFAPISAGIEPLMDLLCLKKFEFVKDFFFGISKRIKMQYFGG
jgi:hypothetical protein